MEPSEDLYFGKSASRKHQRKDQQLCEQVQQAIGLALVGLADDELNSLWVISVEPFPHAGRLRVLLQAPRSGDLSAIAERLEAVRGHLRSEVAFSIHRKKVPSLSFATLPHRVEEEGESW